MLLVVATVLLRYLLTFLSSFDEFHKKNQSFPRLFLSSADTNHGQGTQRLSLGDPVKISSGRDIKEYLNVIHTVTSPALVNKLKLYIILNDYA